MARKFVAASSQKIVFGSALVTVYPLTVACWWNPVSSAVAQNIISIDDATINNSFRIEQDASGHCLNRITAGGTLSTATTSTALSSGTWNHMCGVFTNATSRAAFLNGGGKGTNATNGTPGTPSQTEIGNSVAVAFSNGNIAEVAIWNIALGDTEVAALANGVAAWLVHPEALKFYAPLSMGYSPEINVMSNTNTGTLTNTPTVIDGPAMTYGRRSRFR